MFVRDVLRTGVVAMKMEKKHQMKERNGRINKLDYSVGSGKDGGDKKLHNMDGSREDRKDRCILV